MDDLEEGKDLCPMCQGTLKHNLLPVDGNYYLIFNGSVGSHEELAALQTAVNKASAAGYKIISSAKTNTFETLTIIMEWRWM